MKQNPNYIVEAVLATGDSDAESIAIALGKALNRLIEEASLHPEDSESLLKALTEDKIRLLLSILTESTIIKNCIRRTRK